jgi:hypothetical protein
MYRQQAERLARKIGVERPDLSVDVFQDGTRRASWLVRIYDPVSRQTLAAEGETQARGMLGELRQ